MFSVKRSPVKTASNPELSELNFADEADKQTATRKRKTPPGPDCECQNKLSLLRQDIRAMLSSYDVLMRPKKSSHVKTTLQAKSCGDLESDSSLPNLGKVIQYPSKQEIATSSSYCGSGEYYKRYDYDDMPVKDTLTSETSTDSGKGERISLTESYLNNIEQKISEELQTDSSQNTLDSSVKFFKTTVEEIFSKFYTNMHDFELYKSKFHEILGKDVKDQTECVEEMEVFIKDMIRHIMSSESADFESNIDVVKNKVTAMQTDKSEKSDTSISKLEDLQSVMEAFKNENYNPSPSGSNAKESRQDWKDKVSSSDTLNIFLLSQNPYVKIKMHNASSHLSEIRIMERCKQDLNKVAASAEDMRTLAAKQLELSMLETLTEAGDFADRDIPVKISFAKKNIHSDEDANANRESNKGERSFLGCLCNYLCKKLRKATNLGM